MIVSIKDCSIVKPLLGEHSDPVILITLLGMREEAGWVWGTG